MKIEDMESFPQFVNPFSYDHFHMGSTLGRNVTVMYENHPDKHCNYIIVINTDTGERKKVSFE